MNNRLQSSSSVHVCQEIAGVFFSDACNCTCHLNVNVWLCLLPCVAWHCLVSLKCFKTFVQLIQNYVCPISCASLLWFDTQNFNNHLNPSVTDSVKCRQFSVKHDTAHRRPRLGAMTVLHSRRSTVSLVVMFEVCSLRHMVTVGSLTQPSTCMS